MPANAGGGLTENPVFDRDVRQTGVFGSGTASPALRTAEDCLIGLALQTDRLI